MCSTNQVAKNSARTPPAGHQETNCRSAAIANEHCSEYDQIVAEVGGLTRDELRDAGELDRTYRVRTHVTVEVNLSIEAADDDAVNKIDDLERSDLRGLLRNEIGSIVDNLELKSWDARDAELHD